MYKIRRDKQPAFELRRNGKSYKQISRELSIPTATLAGWFKNEPWSERIKLELIQKQASSSIGQMEKLRQANIARFESFRQKNRNEAIEEFKELKHDPLFLAGLMLYWGEGERNPKSSQVRLGNSDPLMIKTFYLFLKKTLKVQENKIWAWLLLYPDLIDPVQRNFWSASTGLPMGIFKKSIYIKGKHPKKRLAYGVCTIYVSSRALKERILKWIELANNYLVGNN